MNIFARAAAVALATTAVASGWAMPAAALPVTLFGAAGPVVIDSDPGPGVLPATVGITITATGDSDLLTTVTTTVGAFAGVPLFTLDVAVAGVALPTAVLDPGDVYAVTDGLGGLGLAFDLPTDASPLPILAAFGLGGPAGYDFSTDVGQVISPLFLDPALFGVPLSALSPAFAGLDMAILAFGDNAPGGAVFAQGTGLFRVGTTQGSVQGPSTDVPLPAALPLAAAAFGGLAFVARRRRRA